MESRSGQVYLEGMRNASASCTERIDTRRGILAIVSSLFDPLGFIAPYTMKDKLLLQDLFCKKLSWDSLTDEPEKIQWSRWLEDLAQFQNIDVSKCSKPKNWW